MLLGVLLLFLGTFVSCAHSNFEPEVCVVDALNSCFQCVSHDFPDGFELAFDKGRELLCFSPGEFESFLKLCKQHTKIDITTCSYDEGHFACTANGQTLWLQIPSVENYVCFSPKDQKRLVDRCLI